MDASPILNGFDYFKTRHAFEEDTYQEIEAKYGYIIPPMLRAFATTFEWKDLDHDKLCFYFYPNLAIGNIEFHARTLEDMVRFAATANDDDVIDNKLIMLGTAIRNIYIGTLGEQADKILLDDSGELVVIADDIFSFFRGITDNLVQTARSKEEFVSFKQQLGYEGDELIHEGEVWLKYNNSQ